MSRPALGASRARQTRAEYDALLAEVGFTLDDVVATQAPTSLIVARPA